VFWTLTAVGNFIAVAGALALYHFESAYAGNVGALDFLLWSTGTVTTVGYGSVTPQSVGGKVSVLILMMTGPVFVWTYMAFLVTGLVAPEISLLERDVHRIEKELKDLRIPSTEATDTD
jgi:voltage-gated potassium channel Kch